MNFQNRAKLWGRFSQSALGKGALARAYEQEIEGNDDE